LIRCRRLHPCKLAYADTGPAGPAPAISSSPVMRYYDIAVACPLPATLTYAEPAESPERVKVGMRVLVPLGPRLATGYVLAEADAGVVERLASQTTIRRIVDLPDPEPLFPASMVELFRWVARYYHYPIGEVVRTALPGGITAGSGHRLILTARGREERDLLAADPKYGQSPWLTELLDNGVLEEAAVSRLWRSRPCQRKLRSWEKKGLLVIEEILAREKNRRKLEQVLVPAQQFKEQFASCQDVDALLKQLEQSLDSSCSRAERTLLERFLALYRQAGQQPVSRRDLNKIYNGAGRILARPFVCQVLQEEERRIYRNPFGDRPPFMAPPEQLSLEQEQALARICPAIAQQEFARFLLFGVTGSGKTEVYLRASQAALDQGGSVLVLVPEIALASQLEAHFYSRFGDTLAVLHSGLSSGQKFDEWQRIMAGEARVVIGARSAVFAPLDNPGLIIVDEEHDPAYKQDDGLRYNGRDLAVLRARFASCPVVLGSATPSLTSFYHASTGRYTLLAMHKRVGSRTMPSVQIIALAEAAKSRKDLFFSDALIHALEENLEQRNQSLLFVNRRGYASFMLCRDCGHVVRCRHCQVSMTLHRQRDILICHYCGFTLPTNILCPECHAGRIIGLGLGSERIENEVGQLFPHARIARLDSDTVGNRKKYLRLLDAVRSGDIDILVGTQMIAKGLHFPGVTLVGVVLADSGLSMPDYKAAERTFSLLSQVTGRAGRGESAGRVLIQTYQPDHYAIAFAARHDYTGFYEQELAARKELSYPPFSRLVNVRITGSEEGRVKLAAEQVAGFCRATLGTEAGQVLGPAPAPIALLRDRYRYQILLKAWKMAEVHALLDRLVARGQEFCPGAMRLHVDVDPESMM